MVGQQSGSKPVQWMRAALLVAAAWGLASAHAAEPAVPPGTDDRQRIEAFLDELQRSDPAPRVAPQAPAASARATPSAPASPGPAASSDAVGAGARSAALAAADRTAPAVERASPMRALLLAVGGLLLVALAAAGLTTAAIALRNDMRAKRRARNRRFVPYPPRRSRPTAPR